MVVADSMAGVGAAVGPYIEAVSLEQSILGCWNIHIGKGILFNVGDQTAGEDCLPVLTWADGVEKSLNVGDFPINLWLRKQCTNLFECFARPRAKHCLENIL